MQSAVISPNDNTQHLAHTTYLSQGGYGWLVKWLQVLDKLTMINQALERTGWLRCLNTGRHSPVEAVLKQNHRIKLQYLIFFYEI